MTDKPAYFEAIRWDASHTWDQLEQNPRLGGVCMNVGCIPSKALLHATAVMRESKESSKRGIEFGARESNDC